MIEIKSKDEIEKISRASQVVGKVLRQLQEIIEPGITTEAIDQTAEKLLHKFGAVSAFKGYSGYPANICTSINEEVVHGIPGKRRLNEGDIISIDVGAKVDGYFGDAAFTFAIGNVSTVAKDLLAVTYESLQRGIKQARPGNHLSDISSAIQVYAESYDFSIVRKFVGHGIGSKLHEEPEIPNFGKPGIGPQLRVGMVLAIEPMVNQGSYEVEILEDKWTAVTKDRQLSAHFEHTICVTEGKPEILTAWE
ncbi:MAG: type I methionyl aminopeptidase [Candidatus Omnitrophica bacterium]|nr:type I methionyl aminopeptidase [Candidatus Omnitrophota bacterium]